MTGLSGWALVLLPLATLAAAVVGWLGNHHVQHRIHRHHRRVEALRDRFGRYLGLTIEYWVGGGDLERRKVLEAQIVIEGRVIASEYSQLAKANRKMRRSYEDTEEIRTELLDQATGGCFQQTDWHSDFDRPKSVAMMIGKILRTFD